jgi:hypothetical protein
MSINKEGLIFLFLAALWLSGFFFTQTCLAGEGVVISEVAWSGSSESSYDEWLELYNQTNNDVDLSGWTLESRDASPKISLSGLIAGGKYFLLERTNDEASPVQADMFYAGSLGNDGEYLELKDGNGAVVDFIDASGGWIGGDNISKKTLQRCGSSWSSSAFPGGTPAAANDCSTVAEVVFESLSDIPVYRFGDLIINEFLPNPDTGDDEWVELYHPGASRLLLDGWYLSDGSGAKTAIEGEMESGEYFFVVNKPKGSLNNGGDEISLFSSDGNLIDRVVYGDWGLSTETNAPAADKGFSLVLPVDGRKGSYFSDSFVVSGEPTPGRPNRIIAIVSEEVDRGALSSGDVLISEIFPNPVGSDRESEFIELRNQGLVAVDLSGWRLSIKDGKDLEFGRNFFALTHLPAKAYRVIWRKDSLAALDNGGGRLELFSPGKKSPVQVLEYPEMEEGWAFADTLTVGASSSPATLRFLANSLSLERWVLTKLPTPGTDNEIWSENRAPRAAFSLPSSPASGTVLVFDASDSIDEDGDELSFVWDFGDGTSVRGETAVHIFERGGQYTVRLLADDGRVESSLEKVFTIPFQKKIEPFKIAGESGLLENEKNEQAWPLIGAAFLPDEEGDYKNASFSEVLSLKTGDKVEVAGTVLIEPGVFGKQFFYIISPDSEVLKIYDYDSAFPELSVGDAVVVRGEVSGSSERYVKIFNPSDVKVIAFNDCPPPRSSSVNFRDEDVGAFVRIIGRISKADGKIFLFSDSGQARVFLKSGTGLVNSDFEEDVEMELTGLVVSTSLGPAIAPRGREDLSMLGIAEDSDDSFPGPGVILGSVEEKKASSSARQWVLPATKKGDKKTAYAVVLSLGAILLLLGLWFKKRKEDE